MGATVTLTDFTGGSGYIQVDWDGSAEPANFYSWRVFQRTDGLDSWTQVHEDFTSSAGTLTTNTYGWANGTQQEFAAVGVSRDPNSGALSFQDFTGSALITPTGDTKYTLVHPTDPTKTLQLAVTTDDTFTDEDDHEVLRLLGDIDGNGGGFKINRGYGFAQVGSLTAQLLDSPTYGTAQDQLRALRSLHKQAEAVFIRDPFGGLLKAYIGKISITRRAGVGTMEAADVTIPYTELV